MKAGDKITITYAVQSGKPAQPYLCKSGVVTDVDADAFLASGTEYTIAANGNLDLYFKNNNFAVSKIVIVTEGIENMGAPSIDVTAVNGTERTVTITPGVGDGGSAATATYYTTDGTEPTSASTLYTAPFTLNATATVKAVSYLGTAIGKVASKEIEAGTEITLNTPTWTKTAYNTETATSTVTLTSNQSALAGAPTADIYYSIDDADAVKYTEPISIVDGSVLKYYAVATGYANSAEGSVTASAPIAYPVWISETYSGSNSGITVNSEEVVTTIGGSSTPYYYMYTNETRISENLITSSTGISNWLYRAGGIYGGNTQNYAIKGVKKNDYVTITFGAGTESPVPTSGDGAKDDWQSTNNSYVFKVTATMGNFRFNFGRYGYIKSITVQRAQEYASKSIFAAGYATYCSENALDFTNVEGLTAYVATVSGSEVSFTQVEKVPAQTGVLLKGAAGEYQIPVVADGGEATSALVGVLEDTQVAAGSFVLMNGEQGVGFYKTTTAFTVGANTAYLPAQSAGTARSFIGFDGESSTGISSVENSELRTESCFDLQGRRVAQPTKGLYIMNGKKTVVR